MLNNALAFDVRVYDPGAPLYEVAAASSCEPGDPGWTRRAVGATPVGFGAYVDLGWNDRADYVPTSTWSRICRHVPSAPPRPISSRSTSSAGTRATAANDHSFRGTPAVYDTWTWHYENDGRDQDDSRSATATFPTGDDPTARASSTKAPTADDDDASTASTTRWSAKPRRRIPCRSRGVKVMLRVYERDARQVREASVTHSFVP